MSGKQNRPKSLPSGSFSSAGVGRLFLYVSYTAALYGGYVMYDYMPFQIRALYLRETVSPGLTQTNVIDTTLFHAITFRNDLGRK